MENQYKELFGGGQWVAKSKLLKRLEETNIISGIMSNRTQSKDRTVEQVTQACITGLAGELGVAARLGGILNPSEFNQSDRNSFAWDVLDSRNNLKLEIKNHNSKWWTYAPRNVQVLGRNIAEECMDYIVTTKVVELDEEVPGFQIWPRLVINPQSFRKYSKRSQYNSSLYYDHVSAIRDGECFEFNKHLECNTVYKESKPWYNSNNDKFKKGTTV